MVSCKRGEIKRISYKRKSYVKKDGSRVKAGSVGPTCIKDRGKPGKGPRTLPPLSRNRSLTKYGYKLDKPAKERQASLKRASKENTTLAVERRVNLIRNYSKWEPTNYKKLSQDVEFMKKQYAMEKKSK